MTVTKLALSSALTALAVGAAVAAAPFAVAANVDQGPVVAGPTEPVAPINPAAPQGGSAALPHGGPIAIFPQDQLIGGANPYLP